MIRILPYKLSSQSAKLLARELGVLRINPGAATYRRKASHKLINWGCSTTHYEGVFRPGDLNHPVSVAFAADKRTSYEMFAIKGVPTVCWTTDKAEAQRWLQAAKVFGRDTATGHSGQGITVYNPGDTVGDHLFYVHGVKFKREWRIHVGKDRVLDITQKRKANGHPDANYDIRSHANGWRYCRNDIVIPPDSLIQAAKDAVRALDLDFGAVDATCTVDGYNVVFEVNTAPGVEGTTLSKYVDFFKEQLNG